jgi:hypothetical protein
MLTNTSNKKTISNLLESLIEDYVHSNEMFDWCIEDDESYTVYSVKDDEDVHSSILLVGVARFIAAGLNAQIFTEEDNTIEKLLVLERKYVSALAEVSLYEHLMEQSDPYTDDKYDIYVAKHSVSTEKLEIAIMNIESLSENIF